MDFVKAFAQAILWTAAISVAALVPFAAVYGLETVATTAVWIVWGGLRIVGG